MTTNHWSRSLLGVLVLIGALCLMSTASYAADEEEGGADDLKQRIRKQMEKIRQLMQDNETALLDLSAGNKAEPKKVDVDVPPPDGKAKSGGEGGDSNGEKARQSIDELLKKQAQSGEPIPDEMTRLVKMIPL